MKTLVIAAALLSSDSSHYRQALDGFVEAWGSSVTVVAAGSSIPPDARAFVAFGAKAAARELPSDAIVTACLAPAVESAEGDALNRVSLMPDPATLVARSVALLPNLKVLRVFWSSESSREDAAELARAGAERGLTVQLERVSPPTRLPSRLRGLDGKADALWLMPDPALVTEESFAVLREYAAAEKIAFLAPTEGLAERGATATIAVTFRDMGRAAAASLRARLEGGAEPEAVRSARVTVTLNASAARAAGLKTVAAAADKVLP